MFQKLKDCIETMKRNHNQQLNEINNRFSTEISKLSNLINEIKKDGNQKIEERTKEIDNLKKQIKNSKKEGEKKINEKTQEIINLKKQIESNKEEEEQKIYEKTQEIINLKKQIESNRKEEEQKISNLNQEIEKLKKQIENNKIEEENKIVEQNKELENTIIQLKKEINETISVKIEEKEAQTKIQIKNREKEFDALFSTYFDQEKIETFNKLSGEEQITIITKMKESKKDDKVNKVFNLLTFLSGQVQQSKLSNKKFNYIFIYLEDVANDIKLKSDFSSIIGISSQITELLFNNNSIESNQFTSQINGFSEFYIQIQYPSSNFDRIYPKVLTQKDSHQPKLKIEIFISGIKETDAKFQQNQDINSIKLDSTVTTIKGRIKKATYVGSFYNCTSLTRVSIPSSVIYIQDYAFQNCKSLKRIIIPPSVVSIGICAFDECLSLEEVSIPPSVTSFGDHAFSNCPLLSQVLIPRSVTSLFSNTFGSNTKVIKT